MFGWFANSNGQFKSLEPNYLYFFSVTPWMELKPNCGSDRAWVYSVPADYADEEIRPELLAIKFANPESMSDLNIQIILLIIGMSVKCGHFWNPPRYYSNFS